MSTLNQESHSPSFGKMRLFGTPFLYFFSSSSDISNRNGWIFIVRLRKAATEYYLAVIMPPCGDGLRTQSVTTTFFPVEIPTHTANWWHVWLEPTKIARCLGYQELGNQVDTRREIPLTFTYHGPPTVRRWPLLSRNHDVTLLQKMPVMRTADRSETYNLTLTNKFATSACR